MPRIPPTTKAFFCKTTHISVVVCVCIFSTYEAPHHQVISLIFSRQSETVKEKKMFSFIKTKKGEKEGKKERMEKKNEEKKRKKGGRKKGKKTKTKKNLQIEIPTNGRNTILLKKKVCGGDILSSSNSS